MALIRVATVVSSITFATTGVVAITNGVSTAITAAEVTGCVQGFQLGGQPKVVTSAAVTGNMTIKMPPNITSITINGNVYAVDGSGNITNVLPADGTPLVAQGFQLVSG